MGSEPVNSLHADVQQFKCTQVSVGGGLTAWRSVSSAISTITLDGSMCRMYTPVVSVVIAKLLQHLVGIVIRILLLTHLPPLRHTSRCCVRLPQPKSLCVARCKQYIACEGMNSNCIQPICQPETIVIVYNLCLQEVKIPYTTQWMVVTQLYTVSVPNLSEQ